MPVTLSYPGVYVEEVASGVRTIAGIATSVTAFLGRTARGPVNEPVTIFSFGDFERIFGGLHADSTMSYAVRDFFVNGGGQIDYDTRDPGDANLFNLAVKDTATGQTEIFRNVSVQAGHVRQIDNVLRQE
jgi:phage tail sheath protein FI